jgi:L-seryl-tRNA(Ser) seleniumtransferase
MLAALERYLALDHARELRDFEERAETISRAASSVAGVKSEIFTPEVANHVPHVRVTWDAAARGVTAADVVKTLRDGDPSIATRNENESLVIGVWMMRPGEDKIVAKRLREALEAPRSRTTQTGAPAPIDE